jgi:acetylornithine/N-succinyldiaminopimelate aminotransferase
MSTIDVENSLGLSFCERQELAFTHGSGSRVWDEAGKSYLDFTSGWGVTCLGHSHPVITTAVSHQAARLMQSPNAGFTYSPERAQLLATLQTVLPPNLVRTFFCNSGAEANDAALKLARLLTGRSRVLSTRGAFHGRTYNTMAVSRGLDNTSRYLPVVRGTSFVPYGDISAVVKELGNDAAALIVEPIQGEGGVQIPPANWLAELQALCRQRGTLLIVDEVQTGFCRTGRFFAHQHSTHLVEPDILTMGKGIAGGFPFAAFAVSAEVASGLGRDDHGGTYCGNPRGCAVADAVVRFLRDQQVAERVASSGAYLQQGLQQLNMKFPQLIRATRCSGLLCAVEFYDTAHSGVVTRHAAAQGLLVVPTRNGIIRLLPDLLVSNADIDQALATLHEALWKLDTC